MPEQALLVEVTRGGAVESLHWGSAVIADVKGIVWSTGDPDMSVFPRSATKPLQALPLFETGAADARAVSDEEIALACASHNGEAAHVRGVGNWLARIGLSPGALLCGSHWPFDEQSARDLAKAGATPSTLHNNCSGKHAGFLTTALHRREDLGGYIDRAHPVQQRWLAALEELSETSLTNAPIGIDGCCIPSPALPLKALAQAYARFAARACGASSRNDAVARIETALRAHPHALAGTARACTRIIRDTEGAVFAKTGAEGVFAGWIPSRGLGFALKIADGAKRAADVAVAALIQHIVQAPALETMRVQELRTHRGDLAGIVRPADALSFHKPA